MVLRLSMPSASCSTSSSLLGYGWSIGGSASGFIYTDKKQYDLVGTFIPMFGLNNAFGRLFGPLGGGKSGGLFGITFAGNHDLRNLYLPTEFEGNPLRKEFPLLARVVKPWPGIVDVEPMPGEDPEDEEPAEEGGDT